MEMRRRWRSSAACSLILTASTLCGQCVTEAFTIARPSNIAVTKTRGTSRLYAVSVKEVRSPAETDDVTEFFVDNFFDTPPTPKQRQRLKSEVLRDLRERYVAGGTLQRPKGIRSALIAAKDGGRIVGCAGIETKVVKNGRVAAPNRSSVIEAPMLQGDGVELWPVLANLAVDKSVRRRGIGKKLLEECERMASGWGYEALWLLVEEQNKVARRLYEKAGYEVLYRDPKATKVVPTEWQIKDVPCVNVCMRKGVRTSAGVIRLLSLFDK